MSRAPVSAIAREDQVTIDQYSQEDSYTSAQSYSSTLAKRMERNQTTSSVPEMIRDAKEKAEAHRDQLSKLAKATSPRYGDAPMEAYARISRARTPSQAGSAAGYARRRLIQLRSAARTDPDHADQIKAAASQLEKAVGRANRKKLELNREQLARARQKRLAREKRHREEQRIRQELRRSQALRAVRETGYFKEAEIANRLAGQLAATKMELRQQAEQLGISVHKSLDAAIQGYSSAVETAAVADAPHCEPQVDVQA